MPKMSRRKLTGKKKKMIEALEKNLGVVAPSCREVKMTRQTHYDWMRKDPVYAQAVNDIEELAIDFVETKLFRRIRSEDMTGIIFYLKTKAKHRGYSERDDATKTTIEAGGKIGSITRVIVAGDK